MVITEEFFWGYFWNCLPLKFFLCGFTVSSYQQPLYWRRINDGYPTMIDGLFDGIFLIVHRTFLLSYFRGCCLLDFFCAEIISGHIIKRLLSWRRPFLLDDYNSLAMSFVTKLNFWQRKRYRIRLDSFLYLSWFTVTINTTVCSSSVFSTDLERHHYQLDPVNPIFLNIHNHHHHTLYLNTVKDISYN